MGRPPLRGSSSRDEENRKCECFVTLIRQSAKRVLTAAARLLFEGQHVNRATKRTHRGSCLYPTGGVPSGENRRARYPAGEHEYIPQPCATAVRRIAR